MNTISITEIVLSVLLAGALGPVLLRRKKGLLLLLLILVCTILLFPWCHYDLLMWSKIFKSEPPDVTSGAVLALRIEPLRVSLTTRAAATDASGLRPPRSAWQPPSPAAAHFPFSLLS